MFLIGDEDANGNAPWAGWYEKWTACGAGLFRLVGASWTFYWGSVTREEKDQLLRAEWDQPPPEDKKAKGSEALWDRAQPHWHFDRGQLPKICVCPTPTSPPLPHPSSLEDLGAQPALVEVGSPVRPLEREAYQEISLSGLHLGMGGWDCPGSHPQCWQRKVEEPLDLLKWAKHTLQYAVAQFENLSAGEVAC